MESQTNVTNKQKAYKSPAVAHTETSWLTMVNGWIGYLFERYTIYSLVKHLGLYII